jgi:hypothetical protein
VATKATLVITVTSTRGASNVRISGKGRYISLPTNGLNVYAPRQPVQPTATLGTFWRSVLLLAQAELAAIP